MIQKSNDEQSHAQTMIAIPQILTALIVGICYYMLAVVMTVYDGPLSMIFQPIVGVILTGIAIFLLLILGLPIRLSKTVNLWWRKHWWISFVIGTAAFTMMCLSWHSKFRIKVMDPEVNQLVDSFHPALAIGGWMLTLFAVLHFYPPTHWLRNPTR